MNAFDMIRGHLTGEPQPAPPQNTARQRRADRRGAALKLLADRPRPARELAADMGMPVSSASALIAELCRTKRARPVGHVTLPGRRTRTVTVWGVA